jgi:outer membrane protein insertion porin family
VLVKNIRLYVRLILYSVALWSSLAITLHACGKSLVLRHTMQEEMAKAVGLFFEAPALVEDISFESDAYMEKDEFFYLLGFHQGVIISAEHLYKALFYLFCKNKFETIELQVQPGSEGVHIHFILKSFWTFSKLKLQGIVLGKDTYRQYYLIEPGEPFDKKKHVHSIEKIKEAFAQAGFFNGTVQDELVYDEKTRSVTVCLQLYKGTQFSIGEVRTTIVDESLCSSNSTDFLIEEVATFFTSHLAHKYYSKELINAQTAALKRHLSEKGFLHTTIQLTESVEYAKSRVNVQFTLGIHQKREFVFLGNHFFSHAQLLDAILLFGRSAWLLPSSILAQEIKQLYHDKGFWKVSIETKEEKDRYFFIIDEQPRAQMRSVTVKGVDHFDEATVVKRCFSSLLKTKHFDADILKDALDQLNALYVQEGFWDMKIRAKEYRLLPDEWYQLVLEIEEGVQSTITQTVVEGCSSEILPASFFQDEGLVFNLATIQAQKNKLHEILTKQGLVVTEIKPDIVRDHGHVAVTWHVQVEQEHAVFGKAVVVGSQSFPFSSIKRELLFHEGEPWDRHKLKQSLFHLKELTLFDHIHLHPAQKQPFPFEKPIIVTLQKDDPFELRMRTGIGFLRAGKPLDFTGVTYKAGGTFMIKNPTNCADYVKIDIDFTRYETTFTIQYWRPWFFDLPVRTLVQTYGNKFYYPGIIGEERNLYEIIQQGGLIGLSRKWLHVESTTNIGIEWMETRISQHSFDTIFSTRVARAINFEPWLVDKKIPYFLFEPTLFIDFIDNKLAPTTGSLTLISLKAMLPLARLSMKGYFIKIQFEQSVFIPLSFCIFAFRMRFGHIFHNTFSSIMPSERFYLGGFNSLRSYDIDQCPPLGKLKDKNGKTFLVPQGGKSMVNLNLEARFPLYYNLGGVLFQDFGLLTGGSLHKVVLADVLAATGFGLRYATPVGPIRFDIGWKWSVPDRELPRYSWFLTLGQAF